MGRPKKSAAARRGKLPSTLPWMCKLGVDILGLDHVNFKFCLESFTLCSIFWAAYLFVPGIVVSTHYRVQRVTPTERFGVDVGLEEKVSMLPLCPSRCVSLVGRGSWERRPAHGYVWRWLQTREGDRACNCSPGPIRSHRAAEILAGRRVLFLGDSVSRRHLWALVDILLETEARRFSPTTNTSTRPSASFHAAVGDTMYDEQGYDKHSTQTVLVNAIARTAHVFLGGKACTYLDLNHHAGKKRCATGGRHPNSSEARVLRTTSATVVQLMLERVGRDAALSRKLRVDPHNVSRVLTVLTWSYVSSVDKYGALIQSYDHTFIGAGAHVNVLGADYTSVLRKGSMVPLKPDEAYRRADEWRKTFKLASREGKMCASPAICMMRGVMHVGYAADEVSYQAFNARAAKVAEAAGIYYVDLLNATRDGVHGRILHHQDLLRIHYSDHGREFMMQVLLNAIAAVLPPRPRRHEQAIHEGGHQAAHLRLQNPEPRYRNIWEACRAAATGDPPGLPLLKKACDGCGAACHNETLERRSYS
jgi:hypothetical protein